MYLNRMTRMRTIGGPFNMELTSIYALDLSKYIFVDKQREIWVDKILYKDKCRRWKRCSGGAPYLILDLGCP